MVQAMGLDILQRLDTLRRGEDLRMSMKLARLAAGKETAQAIFPEYFVDPTATASATDDLMNPDVKYDYSGVEWESGEQAMEDAKRLAAFLGNTKVEVSGEWV